MPIPVALRDVANEMDVISDEHTAYVNRKTGELITVTEEEMRAAEDAERADDIPEWEREMLAKVRKVLESEDFLALPDKFEIHEYRIMERFCGVVKDEEHQEELLGAIQGRGAFRHFKDTVHRLGIQEDWYDYRTKALEGIAADWLNANGIPYNRDLESSRNGYR